MRAIERKLIHGTWGDRVQLPRETATSTAPDGIGLLDIKTFFPHPVRIMLFADAVAVWAGSLVVFTVESGNDRATYTLDYVQGVNIPPLIIEHVGQAVQVKARLHPLNPTAVVFASAHVGTYAQGTAQNDSRP